MPTPGSAFRHFLLLSGLFNLASASKPDSSYPVSIIFTAKILVVA